MIGNTIDIYLWNFHSWNMPRINKCDFILANIPLDLP